MLLDAAEPGVLIHAGDLRERFIEIQRLASASGGQGFLYLRASSNRPFIAETDN
jgi:hypothetical protein